MLTSPLFSKLVIARKMNEKQILFNKKLFNRIYWEIERAFDDLKVRFVWIYGGSSASKTFSVVQYLIRDMLVGTDNNAIVFRKYHADIKDSIYMDFKNIIAAWGLQKHFIIQQDFIKCTTGSYVRFRGLDDSEKVKGITGFKRVVLEELSQFDEMDLKQIKKRLRGRAGQQIIGIFNPISEEHWVKTKVFDTEVLTEVKADICGKWVNDNGNTVILKTNYLDNVFIVGRWAVNPSGELVQVGGFVDKHVIADFEKDKVSDFAYYQIYGLGNWGRIRTGGEYWKDFNYNLHVKPITWDEALPIRLSWDENVNPYLTCLVWQGSGKTLTLIDEICLEDPRNRVKHVCAEFAKRYPVGRVKGLFVGGDRTSIKEDTKKEKGENFYTDILKELAEYHPRLVMQSVNPSVVQSGGFINEIWAGRVEGLQIIIGQNCKKAIQEYSYTLEDSDGTISKKKIKHPVTGVMYEEFGHISDATRYEAIMYFASEFEYYKRGNKGQLITAGKAIAKGGY